MKNLLLTLSLVLSMPIWADTVDVQNFWFDGSNPIGNLLLNTEKTRTEWRTIRVPATCYRIEYRRQCRQQSSQCRQVCNNGHCRRVCSPPQTVCRTVPVRIPYTCYRMEQRPFEIHDYYVDTYAQLNFDLNNLNGGVGENFKVRVNGEQDGISVQGSKNYLILLNNKNRSEIRNGGIKKVDVSYDISFVSAKKIYETLGKGIQNVTLRNGILSFELGKDFNSVDFIQTLKVYRSRRFSTDILLFDRNLTENEMQVTVNGPKAAITIDLASLGIQIPSSTRIILETNYNTRGALVLNPEDIKTHASANWIFSK